METSKLLVVAPLVLCGGACWPKGLFFEFCLFDRLNKPCGVNHGVFLCCFMLFCWAKIRRLPLKPPQVFGTSSSKDLTYLTHKQ